MLSPFTVPALEGTAGPVTLNDPVFISDLHLSHSEPDTMNAFLRFLEREAAEHAELLILGDFFDYWIGDDVQMFILCREVRRIPIIVIGLFVLSVSVFKRHKM